MIIPKKMYAVNCFKYFVHFECKSMSIKIKKQIIEISKHSYAFIWKSNANKVNIFKTEIFSVLFFFSFISINSSII